MRPSLRITAWTIAACLAVGPALSAASLTPSRAAWYRQLAGAESSGYERARTTADVLAEVRTGGLVELTGNADYEVKELVRLPYARPEVREFVERLAAGYRAECKERLVVTSLVRPQDRRPRNSPRQSPHALGVAIDFRRSWSRVCRGWLEANLLHLENEGVLEASRERRPPHYHVALFSGPYVEYLENAKTGGPQTVRYVVQKGDNLWRIANRYGVELSTLRDYNGLRGTTIRPGQLLKVPVVSATAGAF